MVLDGIYYALALSAGGALVAWVTRPSYAIPLFILALFCLYFFRDPDRAIPAGPVAVSPADGKVVAVKPEAPTLTRISIFLNIFDVHVNRTPIAGTHRGGPVPARASSWWPAARNASAQNEQNIVTVEGDGTRVVFKQIAGLIARRIVFNKKTGRHGRGRRAHRPDQVRLARGRAVRSRVGDRGEAGQARRRPDPA